MDKIQIINNVINFLLFLGHLVRHQESIMPTPFPGREYYLDAKVEVDIDGSKKW